MFQTHTLARAMLAGALGTLAMATTPAIAQTAVAPKDANVGDVATTPLETLNLKKEDIPPLLLQARQAPYSLVGLKSCAALSDEVRKLDAVLGDDIDISDYSQKVLRVGNTAKSIVGSLIPFNGIIRQVSGANESQRQWQVALYAGTARRAFLKGTGLARGCPYPARPARASDYELLRAQRDAQAQQAAEGKRRR
ncbi:MAG: hypothetical protein OC190_06735 [Novosphingobium aromaticivorans]|nr:hypothetical protein [Novosphingobium aromaticivorans]